MTHEERLQRLTAWQETMIALNVEINHLMALTGGSNGPLFQRIFEIQTAYTDLVSEQIGDISGDWLGWWMFDCDFGNKPMMASSSKENHMALVQTLDQLARLIA